MDVTDYNTRLSQARQQYRDSANDLKKSTNEHVEDLETRHEEIQEKQAALYGKDKAELEKQNEEASNYYNKKTYDTIAERTEDYQNRLKEQQATFDNSSTEQKNKFDERLGNLRDSYAKSAEGRDQVYTTKVEQAKERYDNIQNRERAQFQQSINDLDRNSTETSKRFKDQMVVEQKELIKEHENTMRDFANTSAVARTQAAARNARNVASLRDVHATELQHRDDHAAARLESVINTKDDEQVRMRDNFEELSTNISEKNEATVKAENRRTKDILDANEKRYAKDLYNEKRLADEKIKGGNQTEQFENRLLQQEKGFNDRVEAIYTKNENDKFIADSEKNRLGNEFQETIKNMKIKNGKVISDLEMNNQKAFKAHIARAKEDSDNTIKTYKDELRMATTKAEQDAIADQLRNKRVSDVQTRIFGETVKALSDKNSESISKLQAEHAEEKTTFIQGARRDHHNILENTKADLKESFAKKEESLHRRNELQSLDTNIKLTQADEKFERLKDKTAKEINKRSELEAERRDEDRLSHKRDLLAKDREMRLEKVALKDQYEKRLSNEKYNNRVTTEKLVERYEGRIERETGDLRREMKTKLKEATANYNRLSEQSKLEKETLRHQYEVRFEKLRQSQKDQLEALARDRRYS
jgi:hypothetical protein